MICFQTKVRELKFHIVTLVWVHDVQVVFGTSRILREQIRLNLPLTIGTFLAVLLLAHDDDVLKTKPSIADFIKQNESDDTS